MVSPFGAPDFKISPECVNTTQILLVCFSGHSDEGRERRCPSGWMAFDFTFEVVWEASAFSSGQMMSPCVLKVSGCQEEVRDRVKRATAKGTESARGSERHQLDNGDEVFPSEDVPCGRFRSIVSVHAGDLILGAGNCS